ncbi:immunoglobulin superfamily DCC subclass member 3-like [Phocoena sinus]|uniref:immunoglobulin superfamily DCC subclass member 3-like n=1 Tax=Phocoena sinus TaxID=42100 RepID=UPI0013C42050|nr:immunoglobulin superfamily DCC subclass member 3-like [Phocoena sinus]
MHRHRPPMATGLLEPPGWPIHRRRGHPSPGHWEPHDLRCVGPALSRLRLCGQSAGNPGPTHSTGRPARAGTLMLAGISAEDEAIYQCVAENSAGSNQASTRLAVTGDPEPPLAPRGLQAMALSTFAIRVFWEPPPSNGDITGYVLHLRPVGAPAAVGFSTKVLNATSVQASWELPSQLGPIQGFKLFHCKLPAAHFEGALLLASTVSSFLYTDLEPAALYEIKLQTFSGNGDGNSSAHVVSLREVPLATPDGTVSRVQGWVLLQPG